MAIISLIAAVAKNRVIGRGNQLPWKLPEDLRRFRHLTLGHPVIMGRKTYESLGKPLPGRANIVVSRSMAPLPNVDVYASLETALGAASRMDESVFVIGGGEIYAQALPHAARLHITEIRADFAGDAQFPEFDRGEWKEVSRDQRKPEATDGFEYAFVRYDRAPRPS
jgi:dihydrofolate reductase